MERWSFLFACDSHLGTPRSYRFRPAINRRWKAIKEQMAESGADLLLHGGDLTRDGEIHEEEYELAKDDLDTLPFPSFVIPGNMDVGNKHAQKRGTKRPWDDVSLNLKEERLDLFSRYFGPINWTFMHKGVRFTGLYSAVAGTGFKHEKRMWRMLENLEELPKGRHHIAIMHYWPFMENADEPTWNIEDPNQYDNWYFSVDNPFRIRILDLLDAAKVNVLFCGHVHTGREMVRYKGIDVYRAPSAGNTSQLEERWKNAETRVGYYQCEVGHDDLHVRFVPGKDQCEEFGTYGTWGHPTPEQRDYSMAREKPPLVPR